MKDSYMRILIALEEHHSLFGRFWTVGNLYEDKSIPTACIAFDPQSGEGIKFLINPDFWSSIDDYCKTFVIAHECLHVYLEHGRRMKHMDPNIANIAADVVVNHFLVDGFGFDRAKMGEWWRKYCWLETVFPNDPSVKSGECFEYYYNLLIKKAQNDPDGDKPQDDGGKPTIVDSHDHLGKIGDDVLKKIVEGLSQEELENFQDIVEEANKKENEQSAKIAGSMAGAFSMLIKIGRVVKKKKWESVVKNVLGRFIKEKEIINDQWTHKNRRLATVDSGNLMLPAEKEETILHRDKIEVWCFQDTSGSCKHLAERFFKALASIPDDKFHVRVFCFDTKVYETSLKTGKLYGFGGTSFSCIEDHIQNVVRNEKGALYPSVVFVVTDGYGDNVSPEHPSRWHWFLSEQYKQCIPSQSKTYDLKDYE